MLTEPQFWKEVLKRSFWGGWIIAEGALVVVEIAFNALEAFRPAWAEALRPLRGVPIVLLVLVFFIGSYRNAYAIYREFANSALAKGYWGTWRMIARGPSSEFTMTLENDFDAQRSDGNTGLWKVEDGEARITWTSDGWKDKLRLQPDGTVLKTAFSPGSEWTDPPHNTQVGRREWRENR